MTFDPFADVAEFHEKFGLTYDGKPRALLGELGDFRLKFLREELREYAKAMYEASYEVQFRPEMVASKLEDMLDALVDLVYVAIGTAQLHGFDFREAWQRVHAANMTKVRATSKLESARGTTYDVVKPTGWLPPSHEDLVMDHAHGDDL